MSAAAAMPKNVDVLHRLHCALLEAAHRWADGTCSQRDLLAAARELVHAEDRVSDALAAHMLALGEGGRL